MLVSVQLKIESYNEQLALILCGANASDIDDVNIFSETPVEFAMMVCSPTDSINTGISILKVPIEHVRVIFKQ